MMLLDGFALHRMQNDPALIPHNAPMDGAALT